MALVVVHAALAWSFWTAQEFPRGVRDEFFIVELATDIAFGGDHRALLLGDYYPPLLRLPGVLALWAGGSYRGMLAAQALVWLPLLAFGTWWAARRLTGEWGATLAVALLLPAAGILDALHRVEPNLAATAAAAGCLAAFVWSDGLRSRRHVLLLALCLGLGLMVDRLGTLPCVLLPVAWTVLQRRLDPSVRRNALLAAGALLVGVGWWYGLFVRDYAAEWLPQLLAGEVDRSGEVLEARPPWPLWMLHYLWIWPDSQIGLFGGVAMLAGLGWAVARRRDDGVSAVLLWLGLGLVVFTLIPKRQPFYTLPLLPAAAALTAAMVGTRRGLGVVLAALVSVPAFVTARAGGDLEPGLAAWALQNRSPLPESWVGERYPLGQRPDPRLLDVAGLVGALDALGVPPQAPVAVLCTDGVISESQLLSRLRIERRSAEVYGVTVHPAALQERAGQIGVLLDLRPDAGPWPDDAAIVAAFEQRFGWEDDPGLLAAMRALQPRMGRAGPGTDVSGSVLQVWVATD